MISRHKLHFFMLMIGSSIVAFAQAANSDVCPHDDKDFISIRQKAEAKDPSAQMALASCYDLGQHVQPDGKESIRLLTEAANQGYAPAQYEVGRIYLYGRGVPIDYDKALLWERKAAEQGDSRAQRDLAFMYERGFGVSADPVQAAEWNRKAATQGNAEAQLHLATALDDGVGISKDTETARTWYAKAARQEQPLAQLELARESAGQGNCPVAVHWYEEAAGHGNAQAMYEVGRLYLSKCGPHKDLAFKWFTIGARFGSAESKEQADRLGRSLTLSQKRRVQLVVEKWIKEHSGADQDEDEKEKEER
ncbi:MAG TPA: tetratricopeptide repeat protein [Candidatus Angelobacter sp.]|jgi:hypothetical protein